jgi:hypothetical protein
MKIVAAGETLINVDAVTYVEEGTDPLNSAVNNAVVYIHFVGSTEPLMIYLADGGDEFLSYLWAHGERAAQDEER